MTVFGLCDIRAIAKKLARPNVQVAKYTYSIDANKTKFLRPRPK